MIIFILGHRLSELCGHAPMLEEDLALSNIALDMIGQARVLYQYASEVEGQGRDEDMLAFLRKEHEYHNLMLVERPNVDFAHTIVRQLFFSLYAELLWQGLGVSKDNRLSQIAAKAHKESLYHVRHAAEWLVRLGDGTPESATRVTSAVVTMAPHIEEMFETDEFTKLLSEEALIVNPSSLKTAWYESINQIFAQATLDVSLLDVAPLIGARQGDHTEAMGHILAELQYMQRTYPGCQW